MKLRNHHDVGVGEAGSSVVKSQHPIILMDDIDGASPAQYVLAIEVAHGDKDAASATRDHADRQSYGTALVVTHRSEARAPSLAQRRRTSTDCLAGYSATTSCE